VLSILLPILLFVQAILPSAGRWVAALHPVNAFVILGLLGYLSSVMWRRAWGTEAPEARVEEPATVTTT
jgi:thiol:disulfide interchange protein